MHVDDEHTVLAQRFCFSETIRKSRVRFRETIRKLGIFFRQRRVLPPYRIFGTEDEAPRHQPAFAATGGRVLRDQDQLHEAAANSQTDEGKHTVIKKSSRTTETVEATYLT